MFSGLGNMFELLKNARVFQAKMAEMHKELVSRRFDAEAGGGAVRVTADGSGQVLDVRIDPSAAGDVELLEDLLKSATNAALGRSREALQEEMMRMTGGMNLPGLADMLPR